MDRLPLELVYSITCYLDNNDKSHLLQSNVYLRAALIPHHYDHIVFEFDNQKIKNINNKKNKKVANDTEYDDNTDEYFDTINQFNYISRFPDENFICSNRLIRFNGKRLDVFKKYWEKSLLTFLPTTVSKLSLLCTNDKKDKEQFEYFKTRIFSSFENIKQVEVFGSVNVEVQMQDLFPNALYYSAYYLDSSSKTTSETTTTTTTTNANAKKTRKFELINERVNLNKNTRGLRLILCSSSCFDLLPQLPIELECLKIDYGHQHLPREGGDLKYNLTSEFMQQYLEPCFDNLKTLKVYWHIPRGVDYNWIPKEIEHLQLLDGQPASVSRRTGTVELDMLYSLELDSKYGRALRRLIAPNLKCLTLKSPRFGQLENQIDAVTTLKSASRELQLDYLDFHSLSYGVIQQFDSESIKVLVLRNIMGGTTAFTDMTETMEDFLIQMTKLYPSLETLYVEIDNPIASDQFRLILGYFMRRKPDLDLRFGFESAQLVNRILGSDLLQGAMAKSSRYIDTSVKRIDTRNAHVYRLVRTNFY